MKLNFKTLCACLALVTYAGTAIAGGESTSSSIKNKGKQSAETKSSKKTLSAAEWEAKEKKYKYAYKKEKEKNQRLQKELDEALKKIKEFEAQINNLKQSDDNNLQQTHGNQPKGKEREESIDNLKQKEVSFSYDRYDGNLQGTYENQPKGKEREESIDNLKQEAGSDDEDSDIDSDGEDWSSGIDGQQPSNEKLPRELYKALKHRNTKVIEKFIERGIDFRELGGRALTREIRMSSSGITKESWEFWKFLLEKGADINYETEEGTALFVAVKYSSKENGIIGFLLENGADPNAGKSVPLIEAIFRYSENYDQAHQMFQFLLQHGADPNRSSYDGDNNYSHEVVGGGTTALMALCEKLEFCKNFDYDLRLLMKYGSDPRAQNKERYGAIHWLPKDYDSDRQKFFKFEADIEGFISNLRYLDLTRPIDDVHYSLYSLFEYYKNKTGKDLNVNDFHDITDIPNEILSLPSLQWIKLKTIDDRIVTYDGERLIPEIAKRIRIDMQQLHQKFKYPIQKYSGPAETVVKYVLFGKNKTRLSKEQLENKLKYDNKTSVEDEFVRNLKLIKEEFERRKGRKEVTENSEEFSLINEITALTRTNLFQRYLKESRGYNQNTGEEVRALFVP